MDYDTRQQWIDVEIRGGKGMKFRPRKFKKTKRCHINTLVIIFVSLYPIFFPQKILTWFIYKANNKIQRNKNALTTIRQTKFKIDEENESKEKHAETKRENSCKKILYTCPR